MTEAADESQPTETFIADWRETGGSELANTQSFINGLCQLLGVAPPSGSRVNDAQNDYVFERRVFQDNGDGTESFGRIDCYKRDCFVLEAKQGSEGRSTGPRPRGRRSRPLRPDGIGAPKTRYRPAWNAQLGQGYGASQRVG